MCIRDRNNNDDSTIANESISGSKSNRLLENLFRAMVVKEALTPEPLFYHFPMFINNPNLTNISTLALAFLTSIFLFVIWKERATSKMGRERRPSCQALRNNFKKSKRSWYLAFSLSFVILTYLIWKIQLLPSKHETSGSRMIIQFIVLDFGIILINAIVAKSFRVYYLHHGPDVSGYDFSLSNEQMC